MMIDRSIAVCARAARTVAFRGVTGGGHRVVALAAVLACTLAAAATARADWDCGAGGQPACPPSDPAGADGALPVSSPLRPLAAPVRGRRLFGKVNGHLAAGFNEGSVGLGAAQPVQAAALGSGLGASLVRIPLNWAFTQARAGGPADWHAWDRRYRAYVALGIRPIWAIQAAPRWAIDPRFASDACPVQPLRLLQAGQECLTGPDAAHRADYAAFAAQVARRYPLSAAIEIWNEPNLAYYWRAPDAAAYGALARAATAAVRQADPAMRVLVGALAAPLDEADGRAVALDAFAAELARDGTVAAADGLSFHPYPQRPDAGPFRAAFAQVATALGTLRTRLVADELGASTAPRGGGQYEFTENEQRDVVLSSFTAMDAADPSLPRSRDVDAVLFHTDIDGPRGFGFITPTLSASGGFAPRPVFCAIAQLLRGTGLCGLPAAAPVAPVVKPRKRRGARACAGARRGRAPARAGHGRSRRGRAGKRGARAHRRHAHGRAGHRRCGRSRPGRHRRRHR
jgi:hypothetical protein